MIPTKLVGRWIMEEGIIVASKVLDIVVSMVSLFSGDGSRTGQVYIWVEGGDKFASAMAECVCDLLIIYILCTERVIS